MAIRVGLIALAAAGSCQGTDDDGAVSVPSIQTCRSGISWWGTVDTGTEDLVLEGCLNDECRTRMVRVGPPDQCQSSTEWHEDWGSWACAVRVAGSQDVVEVVFGLDVTLRANELEHGDQTRFSVRETMTDEELYERHDVVAYDGERDSGVSCYTQSFLFGAVALGLDSSVMRDAGVP